MVGRERRIGLWDDVGGGEGEAGGEGSERCWSAGESIEAIVMELVNKVYFEPDTDVFIVAIGGQSV